MKIAKIAITLAATCIWLYFIKQETGWVTTAFCAIQYAMWWIVISIIGKHNKTLGILVK